MKVTYRSIVSQPRGSLNPLGLHLSQPLPIEIYEAKTGMWKARDPRSKIEWQLPHQPKATAMQELVNKNFACQVEPWSICDSKGEPIPADTIIIAPDGTVSQRILTHIAAAGYQPADSPQFKTACDGNVNARHLVSRRGDVAPTCPDCKAAFFQRDPIKQ